MNMPRPAETTAPCDATLPSDEDTDPQPRPRPHPQPMPRIHLGGSHSPTAPDNGPDSDTLSSAGASLDGLSDAEETNSTCSGARDQQPDAGAGAGGHGAIRTPAAPLRHPQLKRPRDASPVVDDEALLQQLLDQVAATNTPCQPAPNALSFRRYTFDEKAEFLDRTRGLSLKHAEAVLGIHQQNIRNWRKAEASIRAHVERGFGGHISCAPVNRRTASAPALGKPFVQIFPGQ